MFRITSTYIYIYKTNESKYINEERIALLLNMQFGRRGYCVFDVQTIDIQHAS